MKLFSLSFFAIVAVFAYICHTVYVIYGVWNPSSCPSNNKNRCMLPYKPAGKGSWNLKVYCTKRKKPTFKSLTPIWEIKNIDFQNTATKTVTKDLPSTNKLSTNLILHAVLYEDGSSESGDYAVSRSMDLTKYSKPVKYFKLVSDENETQSHAKDEEVLHWRSKIYINVVHPPFKFDRHDFPMDILHHIKQIAKYGTYLPILFIDELSILRTDLKEIKSDMTNISIDISYAPMSIGKLRLWNQLIHSLTYMKGLGFTDEDTEEIRGIFTDTNIWFLALTFFVSTFHLLFDFLAFKHDINFWRNRESMAGLSFNTVVYRCISTIIIFFYLMNEKSSYLILVPSGIGSLIEIWKVTRALKVKLVRNGWRFQIDVGGHSKSEQTTENYDHEAIKYLSYVLYPLIVLGAIYSLFYVPHKSWYSWLIHSLANGVYAFGFLFMLPQLFINYKMKSVAHLPWKAFTYKAFNTFIDDVFAFIIRMPTSHRIACFRDDVVFFCYLYQRWLYPVDKTRVNEFGISYEDEDEKKKK